MNNTIRWILSVLTAMIIYPIAMMIISAVTVLVLTVGIIGLTALWLYKGSKH